MLHTTYEDSKYWIGPLGQLEQDLAQGGNEIAVLPETEHSTGFVYEVWEIVNSMGKDVTFHVASTPTYDPATGETTAAAAVESTQTVTPPYPYSMQFVDGELIKKGDAVIYLPSSGLPFTPDLGMKVTIDSVNWKIVAIMTIFTFSEAGLYELRIRR